MDIARELIGLLLMLGGLAICLSSGIAALLVKAARAGLGRSQRTGMLLIVSGGMTAASWWSLALLVVLAAVYRSGLRRGSQPLAT